MIKWLFSKFRKKRININEVPTANLFPMPIKLPVLPTKFKTIKPCKYWGGYLNLRIIEYTDGTCELQECQNGEWIVKQSGTTFDIISQHIGWINGSTGIHTYRDIN